MTTALAPTKQSLVQSFAAKYNVDEAKFLDTLKATAFKQKDNVQITNEQMTMLLVVADQYGLNPFTKEIYAYPDKGAIVPVVSVDGWARIINENPQMDGLEFEYSPETTQHKGKKVHEWIDCIITRKDRAKPVVVREFLDEVMRTVSFVTPWDTHPKRMHRHKTLIQAARLAFGFAGIYDQDEAERIIEGETINSTATLVKETKPERKTMTLAELNAKYTKDKSNGEGVITQFSPKSLIERGEETAQNLIDFLSAKYTLPADVLEAINSWTTIQGEAA
jgi:phage recombination protein Bet